MENVKSSSVDTRDQERAEGGLELPTYADSVRPTGLPGFTNPQYSVEVGREGGEEVWGEGEGDTDDQPPPYSPGFGGGPRGEYLAPPEYFAIFGQIRDAREESTNHFVFLRRLLQIMVNTIGCTVLLIVFMSVPIAVLGLGVYFIGDCPAEPNIPIFLVVGGVSGALKNIALVFENIVKRTSHRFSIESIHKLRYAKFAWRVVNLVFDLFLVAWILAGSYWIYHVYREVDPGFDNCNETLYKFAFGVITSSYILFAMMCCCMCVCSLCLLPRGGGESEVGEERERGDDTHSLTPHSDPQGSPPPPPHTSETRSDDVGVSQNGEILEPNSENIREDGESLNAPDRVSHTSSHGDGSHGDGGSRRQQAMSLDNLEPLSIAEYNLTPALSPRATRQSVANEQGPPLSFRTTSV